MRRLKTFLFGLAYGITSPIPGVDGGTLFILFNVYEDFILSANFSGLRKKLPFVFLFVVGCILGLFGISRLMIHLLNHHEMMTYFAFVGLIIGCIPIIYKKSALNLSENKPKFKNIMICLLSFTVLFYIIQNRGEAIFNAELNELYETPTLFILVFILSAISSIGMLIPGVGGAIIMLLLGIHSVYLKAVANMEWMVLLTLILGMALGISLGIKVVRKLLVDYPRELYCSILGFTTASVFIVFPGFVASLEGVLAVLCAIVFMIIAYKFSMQEIK